MNGLDILSRSMTLATTGPPTGKRFQFGNSWQYHPRSDRHSKIACWAVTFDLLQESALLREHIATQKVAIGINHPMRDFSQNRTKNLDLVICRASATTPTKPGDFANLAERYAIVLSESEQQTLKQFPNLPLAIPATVLVAMEAKACMTEFGKARPRLYDELNSSHLTIHGDTNAAIAAGFAMVNIAETFVSPLRNPWSLSTHEPVISHHRQSENARSVIQKIMKLPRRSSVATSGFDAFGIAIINCANDGSPVVAIGELIEPTAAAFAYADFIVRLAHLYSTRFATL
jgi:hypothetical protein